MSLNTHLIDPEVRCACYISILTWVLVALLSGCSQPREDVDILFPRGFALAVDDLGWMKGQSLAHLGGPWRLRIDRDFTEQDYHPFVEIGGTVGTRIQCLFVLTELDRENIVAKYPSMSKEGAQHDNSSNVSGEQIAIMNYVKENAAFLEFGLHGVSHESYNNGLRNRAEWYDIENKRPREEHIVKDHLNAFRSIMEQYGLSEKEGHSFPQSFVPCAYGYHWNPGGASSTGKIMNEFGVKYANSETELLKDQNGPVANDGGFDNGVLLLDRSGVANYWAYAAVPQPRNFPTDIIETHWPNFLTEKEEDQQEANKKWIQFYRDIEAMPDRYVAKNTEQLYSQWLYQKYTKIIHEPGGCLLIDNRSMPNEIYAHGLLGNMVLAVALGPGRHVQEAMLNKMPIVAYHETGGYGYIYLPPLSQEQYRFCCTLGSTKVKDIVYNSGTYNIYKIERKRKFVSITLKMYGRQDVSYATNKCPREVKSINALEIQSWTYQDGQLVMTIASLDIQGESGTIHIFF